MWSACFSDSWFGWATHSSIYNNCFSVPTLHFFCLFTNLTKYCCNDRFPVQFLDFVICGFFLTDGMAGYYLQQCVLNLFWSQTLSFCPLSWLGIKIVFPTTQQFSTLCWVKDLRLQTFYNFVVIMTIFNSCLGEQ